jgi:hypothetical protein
MNRAKSPEDSSGLAARSGVGEGVGVGEGSSGGRGVTRGGWVGVEVTSWVDGMEHAFKVNTRINIRILFLIIIKVL